MNLYDYYEELYKLTEKQNEYILEKDYDQLLEILAQKQEIIDKVDKLGPEDYIKAQKEPNQALSKLKKLMTEIKEMEDKNEKDIKKNKGELKSNMKDLTLKQKGRKGYKKAIKYEAKFIDKRS